MWQRIEEVRSLQPPKKGVKSRLGHASADYFAELLGTDRQRLAYWKRGGEPEARYRDRLAELSQGLYSPDDFATRRLAAERAEAAEQELEDLRADLQSLGETVTRLGNTLTQLVEAQRPTLRARLQRALAGESP